MRYLSSYWIRSSFYSLSQRFFNAFFGVINFMILVRMLTRPQMGIWTLFLAITTALEISKVSLIKSAHIRFISSSNDANEKKVIAWSSLTINLLISFIFIIVILLFSSSISVWLNSGNELNSLLIAFIPGLIVVSIYTHYEAVHQSYLDFSGPFFAQTAKQLTMFLFIITYYLSGKNLSLETLVIYYILSHLMGVFIMLILARKKLSFYPKASLLWVKKIIRFGGYILGSSIIFNLSVNLDQFLISRFLTPLKLSYYSIANRIANMIDIPVQSAADILFPKMSKDAKELGIGSVKLYHEKAVAILLSIILPIVIITVVFAKYFILLIAGTRYLDSTHILQLMMLASISGMIGFQISNSLTSIGRSQLCFYLNISVFIFKAFFVYTFLKTFGFLGAAWATLLVNFINLVIWQYFANRVLGITMKNIYAELINVYATVFKRIFRYK